MKGRGDEPKVQTDPGAVLTQSRHLWYIEAIASSFTTVDHSSQAAIDSFPEAYARTQRFASGLPRNFSILSPVKHRQSDRSASDSGDARILFLRAASSEDATLCLWLLDLATKEETLLVGPGELDESALTDAEKARRERTRESASGIVAYSLDQAKTTACLVNGGKLMVVDLDSGVIQTPPTGGTVFDPRLSPDGKYVAYVDGDTLRVLELDRPGSDRVLMADSIPGVSYGRADFVAAEEMGRRRGFWWSPCSQRLLVTKVDERPVDEWWIGDAAFPDQKPSPIRYPKAGTRNVQTDLLLVDPETGAFNPIDWDADDHYEYLANVVWTTDAPEDLKPGEKVNPIIVRQTRDQREVSIAELEMDSHSMRSVETLFDDIWVELIPTSPTVSKYGILTIEDLWTEAPPHDDGQRSIVLNGAAITSKTLNVQSIIGLFGSYVLFSASPEATEVHIYAVDLTPAVEGTAKAPAQQLTATAGVHSAVMGHTSTDDTTILITSASADVPGSTSVAYKLNVDRRTGDRLTMSAPIATVADSSEVPPISARPLFVNLGTDQLPTALFLPSNYDGSSQLPVLLDPYGGPHGQRVLKSHNRHLVSQWFAEQGYAVIVTDGSGTPGRGPTWERRVWGDLATLALEDQLNALDAAASEFEGLDLSRVGIRGWSFGGYLAALAAIRAPSRIHAAIAGAPVTSWRLYDTHYTERYLGHPDQYPHHYEQTDLIAAAHELTRPLLLIHGLADDNVVGAHTLRMSSALLAAGKSHQVLPLSGVTHMTPQRSIAENLLWLQLDFLNTNLQNQSSKADGSAVVSSGAL